MKQIFGYTGPTPPTGYVKFVQAFDEDGVIRICVRDNDCRQISVEIPYDEAAELACQLNMASFGRLPSARVR